MKDGAMIKCVSIGGTVVIVCVMLATDGNIALAAAGTALAGLSGIGGYTIAKRIEAAK